MKRFIKAVVGRAGFEIRTRQRVGRSGGFEFERVSPRATYAPWRTDRAFQKVYPLVRDSTALDVYRLYGLWQAVEQVEDVPGDLIEVGVWKGGSGLLMAQRALPTDPPKVTFLADTWRGVVKSGARDTEYADGMFGDARITDVKALQRKMGLARVQYLPGIFPEESTGWLVDEGTVFAMAHLDMDTYQSTADAFAFLWPRLSVGGLMVFDDYGFLGTEGPVRFVEEQRASPGRVTVHSLSGQAIMVKTAGEVLA
jgi:O-methyltransferase